MKISLIYTGKTNFNFIQHGLSEYENRLKYYANIETFTIFIDNKRKGYSIEKIKEEEGKILLKMIQKNTILVLLDVKGRLLSSEDFADFINKQQLTGKKILTFVIGGAYGFSDAVYKRADFRISLSPMTFSHQLVRLIFMEQLYRAYTILKGEPYHH